MAKKDYTRTTFILDPELVNKLKDYAYTNRVTIRDALEKILREFLKDQHDLLPHPGRK